MVRNLEKVIKKILFSSHPMLQNISIVLSTGRAKYMIVFYHKPSHIITGKEKNAITHELRTLLRMLGENENEFETEFMVGF